MRSQWEKERTWEDEEDRENHGNQENRGVGKGGYSKKFALFSEIQQ